MVRRCLVAQDSAMVLILSPVFPGIQAVAGMVPARHRFLTPNGKRGGRDRVVAA